MWIGNNTRTHYKMTKNTIREIIETYLAEDASDEVRMTFEKWLTDGTTVEEKDEALNAIWDNLSLTSAYPTEDPFSIIAEAEKIENLEDHRTSRRKTVWLWVTSSIAACMAAFAILGWSQPEYNETCLVSSVNSKGEFRLPDGSVVWLNKDSRLYFLNDLESEQRKVRLEGEGYFDVAKDTERPFIVQAGGLSIRVLGTRFTVSAYQGSPVEAYLEEGSILAKVPEHDPVILEPDQAVVYDPAGDTFLKFSETASDHTAWIDGRLEFVNKSLKDIMDCLEHWFCVKISCNDMVAASGIRLSMTIRQESIEEICRAMSTIAGLSYFIDTKGNVKISIER